jgi:hypothetical protein
MKRQGRERQTNEAREGPSYGPSTSFADATKKNLFRKVKSKQMDNNTKRNLLRSIPNFKKEAIS